MVDLENKRKTKKTATADTLGETPHPKRNTHHNKPSLAETHPNLTKEWDYEANAKNGYTPYNITAGSGYRAHWICPDKACRHYKYQATVCRRSAGSGCPAKAGKIVVVGYNDLNTTHPNLTKEWDYEANAESGYTPYNIMAGSNYKAHWICPDEECGHYKYTATVNRRSRRKGGCAVKDGRRLVVGYNDLNTTHPNLTKEWDYEANAESGYTPYNITAGSGYRAHWICLDEECGHYKYQAIVYSRSAGKGCPAKVGRAVVVGYNDLNTTHPNLTKEWDYEANAKSGYTPYNVTAGNGYKAHWICPDEKCRYKYKAVVSKRTGKKSAGCPAKAGRVVVVGYNDLNTTHPNLTKEWDYEANAKSGYTPYNVTAGRNYKAHWICPDEECGHKYTAMLCNRTKQKPNGCTACAKTGFNTEKKGYLYFVEGKCLAKIGITSCLTDRLKRHEHFAPKLLDVWAGKGSNVHSAEQMILKMINDPASGIDVCLKHGEKFDGCKETWSLSDITPNPKDLPELIHILSGLNLSVDSVDLEALGLHRLTKEEIVKEFSP